MSQVSDVGDHVIALQALVLTLIGRVGGSQADVAAIYDQAITAVQKSGSPHKEGAVKALQLMKPQA